MFLLDVLHSQWLMLAFGGGLFLMLVICLAYTAGWRSVREEEKRVRVPLDGIRPWGRWLLGTFPWILLLTLIGIAVWSFIYPLFKAVHPPN